jgi:hypothetical protein
MIAMAPLLRHDGVMDLTPYVDRVRQELLVAAEAAGDEGRAIAERLVAPLDSAIRLTLLNALSTAADEITREMAPGSVDLRLRGLDPSFVVTSAPADEWTEEPRGAMVAPTPAPVADDEGATARINFRPPEHLKARIEEAAGREGLSVNSWLVRAVSGVLDAPGLRAKQRPPSGGQSFTGWVR